MRTFEVRMLRVVICVLICSVCFSQKKKDDWHLYKNEQGIAVYYRLAAGSEYRDIKSVLSLKTSLNSMVALIFDWSSYPLWIYKCGESKTLKKISETEVIHYQTTLVPWPANDQDFVLNIKLTQHEKTRVVTIKSTNMPNYIPVVNGRSRVEEFNSVWILTPLKDGTVQVTYQFRVKPSGMIPVWVVNMAALMGPHESMVNFKEWVMQDTYQKAKKTVVNELID